MIYHEIKVKPYAGAFHVTSSNGTGYLSSRSCTDTMCFLHLPSIFISLCYGSGHRRDIAFTSYEWLAALNLVSKLNRMVAQGKRDMTQDSIGLEFNALNKSMFKAYKEIEAEAFREAQRLANENGKLYSVSTERNATGVVFHVCEQGKLPSFPVEVEGWRKSELILA